MGLSFDLSNMGKPRRTLQDVRDEQKLAIDIQKNAREGQQFQTLQEELARKRILERAKVDRTGAAAEWSQTFNTQVQYDASNDSFLDVQSGGRFRLNDKGDIESINPRQETAGNFMAQLRGSGGVKPGQDPALVAAFAQSGATPELRTEAQGIQKRERELSPPKTFGDEATLLSRELFGGRDPGQLGPPEVGRLNREVQQRALARERERGSEAARIQIQGSLDRPIAAKERKNYLDPETFQPIPSTVKTERDLLEVGAVYADPKQRDELNALNESSTILASLDGLTKSIITATNPAEAGLQKLRLEGGAFTKQNEVAATYKDTLKSFLTKLGKQLGGDTGVFTNQDLERILNGLPGFGDTAPIRDYKVGLFRLLIETGQDAKRLTILGMPYEKAASRARVDALIEALEGVNPEANAPTPPEEIDRRIQELEEKARR